MQSVINGKIITESGVLEDNVLIFDEKIIDITDIDTLKSFEKVEKIDAGGKYVSPGFIDIHIHGCGGADTMDADSDSLNIISKTLSSCGVTSFLATTMTMSKEDVHKALKNIRSERERGLVGANLLGAHLEGPFINDKYKGAQNGNYIIPPDFEFIKDYLDVIKVITIAPECDDDFRFIERMREFKTIVLSMGHTDASYDTAVEAIKRGVSHATHTFNAMSPLNHREPGAVGAVLTSDISCEIIADKIHVHSAAINILAKLKGIDRIVLITDCMRAGCMQEGKYDLGGQEVIVKGSSARLENGSLAGSVLTMNKAILNVMGMAGISIFEAVKMASLNPAKVLRLDDKKGSIKKGKDADITIFDERLDIYLTIVNGKEVYRA